MDTDTSMIPYIQVRLFRSASAAPPSGQFPVLPEAEYRRIATLVVGEVRFSRCAGIFNCQRGIFVPRSTTVPLSEVL
jgi:hypothetical protein